MSHDNEVKNRVFTMRLSQAEFEKIKRGAALERRSPSDFCRVAALVRTEALETSVPQSNTARAV